MRRRHSPAAEKCIRTIKISGEDFVGTGQRLQLGLHLGLQSGELGLVAAFSLFGEGLEGFSFALVGLLAEGVAFFQDAHVELELLLALVLAALEPAAEDLQEGGAAPEDGKAGDDAIDELAHARDAGDLQTIARGEGEMDLHQEWGLE